MLLQWQQQSSGSSSSSDGKLTFQQHLTVAHSMCRSVKLLVECLLLLPGIDMAGSCLQAIALMMQRANASFRQAAEDSASDSSNRTPLDHVQCTLPELASAVYHVAQQAGSIKKRRHLLQLWADAVAALLDEIGECWETHG
jgi:hypothetical protein